MYRTLLFLFVFALGGASFAEPSLPDGSVDDLLNEDRRVESDTPLGRFSLGVSGVSEDSRTRVTRGDVEIGRFFEYRYDTVFPKVLQVRPIVFNRIDSASTEYYRSLGLGAGVRLSVRDLYEQSNWFARVAVMSPTQLYDETAGLKQDEREVVEAIAGYEFLLDDDLQSRTMRERIRPMRVIEVAVPAEWLSGSSGLERGLMAWVHTRIIQRYLAAVSRLVSDSGRAAAWPRSFEADSRLVFIQRMGELPVSDRRWRWLRYEDAGHLGKGSPAGRSFANDLVRRGLTRMMRDAFPLVLVPMRDTYARGESLEQDGGSVVVARACRPGMNSEKQGDFFDADTMIGDYVKSFGPASREAGE